MMCRHLEMSDGQRETLSMLSRLRMTRCGRCSGKALLMAVDGCQ